MGAHPRRERPNAELRRGVRRALRRGPAPRAIGRAPIESAAIPWRRAPDAL